MKYAQLWQINASGKIDWCLGSDGIIYLDGRYGKTRIHDAIRDIVEKRRLSNKVVGYTIHRSINAITEQPNNLINL